MLSPDFSEFAALLNAHEVRYLVVGGYAVAFHGHPRYTKDFDVWVDRSPENVERLLTALRAFGFGSVGLVSADFTTPDRVVQLGVPPQRIDLLTSLEGAEFEAAYADHVEVELEEVTLPVIGLEALKANKRTLGRHQDLADLEKLE